MARGAVSSFWHGRFPISELRPRPLPRVPLMCRYSFAARGVIVHVQKIVICDGWDSFSTNSHIRETSPREFVENASQLSQLPQFTFVISQFPCRTRCPVCR